MQSGGGDECPSLGHLAGHGREREREVLMVEVSGSVWRLEFWKGLEFWKMEKLVACGGRKRIKGKGKKEKKL